MRKRILEEYIAPTVDEKLNLNPYTLPVSKMTKEEIQKQLSSAKEKNSLLMKNIEQLKAQSENGKKKIQQKIFKTTVKDLEMLKNPSMSPY